MSTEKFGLDKELAAKLEAKFDPQLEEQARIFICQKTGQDIAPGAHCLNALKDGVLLCKLMNILKPGSVSKINTNKMAFMMMENIGNYLKACQVYGVRNSELFQTIDLYEEQNMHAVVTNILAVARLAGFAVQASTSTGTAAYEVAEKAYVPPAETAPALQTRAGSYKPSNDIPLMLAGAAKAGDAAIKGAFTPGKRDIVSGSSGDLKGTSDVPLLQAGMAAAGTSAIKGAFGSGSRAEIVKSNNVDYGTKGPTAQTDDVPLMVKQAGEIGEEARKGAFGPGLGTKIDKYS
eukprot:c17591_g1_i1.p1 GENE.c17591_g1_i1~~c17591_g1_i1.p1  ORF type:complete len:291 (-),score=69.36 c17591_g1_i1:192-1064(-)